MTTRRTFIQVIPVSGTVIGAVFLAACSDKATPPVAAPAAAPEPVAPPAPAAPVAAAPAATPAPAPAATGPAAAGPMVDEKDAIAVSLGYVADSGRVDKAKYPNHAAGQACSSCALFQGGGAESGGCPLFAGKQVSAKGWCSAFAKKAA